MKLNKKGILSSVILVTSIAVSSLSTYGFKATADEETLAQVKMQLQEQIDDKTKELEDKDKQLEDLNNKVSEQENTINQLNSSIQSLNEGLNNTNAALDNAKKVQSQDKVEVVEYSNAGDEKLQKQIDEQKENYDSMHKTNPPVEAKRNDPHPKLNE